MKLKMYAIRDSKAVIYNPAPYFNARGEATRWFTQILDQGEHIMSKFPEDFDLFELGTFDQDTCRMELEPAPIHVGKAIDFKTKPSQAVTQQDLLQAVN